MKNIYSAPEFKLILLTAQDVLTGSFEEAKEDGSDPHGQDIF